MKAAAVGWEPERVTADDALVALYLEHATRLVGMLTVYVGNQSAAEDLAQEAFLRTYRSWGPVRDEDRAASYLYRTAFSLARWSRARVSTNDGRKPRGHCPCGASPASSRTAVGASSPRRVRKSRSV